MKGRGILGMHELLSKLLKGIYTGFRAWLGVALGFRA